MRDKGWFRQILRGDKAAGERFITENYPAIHRLLRYLTNNAEAAEDLTQQTFVKAWQGMNSFRNETSLRTWLHRIAYHEYTHWLRARREHAPLDAAAHLPEENSLPEWDMVFLPRALAQLSEEHRDTFLLYYLQELSVAEVAAVLKISKGTVKSRLFVARQRLRELFQREQILSEREPAPSLSAETAKEVIPHEL